MSKKSELRTKLIREIEDMVEDAFPNLLHEQDFIFTRLHSNIQARVLYESTYKERLKTKPKRPTTNE